MHNLSSTLNIIANQILVALVVNVVVVIREDEGGVP